MISDGRASQWVGGRPAVSLGRRLRRRACGRLLDAPFIAFIAAGCDLEASTSSPRSVASRTSQAWLLDVPYLSLIVSVNIGLQDDRQSERSRPPSSFVGTAQKRQNGCETQYSSSLKGDRALVIAALTRPCLSSRGTFAPQGHFHRGGSCEEIPDTVDTQTHSLHDTRSNRRQPVGSSSPRAKRRNVRHCLPWLRATTNTATCQLWPSSCVHSSRLGPDQGGRAPARSPSPFTTTRTAQATPTSESCSTSHHVHARHQDLGRSHA
jgi:hypothetical protein